MGILAGLLWAMIAPILMLLSASWGCGNNLADATPAPTQNRPPVFAEPSAPPDRDLVDLAARLRGAPPPAATPPTAAPLELGHREDFTIVSALDASARNITATLRAVSDNAYWFVDDAVQVDQPNLERSARIFEDRVWAPVTGAFGGIRNPGVDGDPRLFILHTELDAALGYFRESDGFPAEVHPQSNEREIIYIGVNRLRVGGGAYMSVIAHELQHAIHFNQDAGEEAWVNEGLSELASELAGYEAESVSHFLRKPGTQLNYWPESPADSIPSYGAAALFFKYVAQRVGGVQRLADLASEPLDGIDGVDAFLRKHGMTFEEIFADWVAANYAGVQDDRYGYPDADVRIRRALPLRPGDDRRDSLPQFSTRYYVLPGDSAGKLITFRGDTSVAQVGEDCPAESGCWWSGRGDAINTRLTAEFDLTGMDAATLEYEIWWDIEEGWDYGYVEASADGGQTWRILETDRTTRENPSGNAYGPGYTGGGNGWRPESIDLTPFAGAPALIRFEYVTDGAVYLDGFMLADISVSSADQRVPASNWNPEGFRLIQGNLPQRFIIQLIQPTPDGNVKVSRITPDQNNHAQTPAPNAAAIIAISPITPATRHPAAYQLSLSE